MRITTGCCGDELPENRISDRLLVGDLSGGEKIKFQLLCEMLRRHTVLLLDEPSNDLDLQSVKWLEGFIRDSRIPIMFVSHDETLLEHCANTIIHLEQLMRKRQPQHTMARLTYPEYVRARNERIIKQTQVAQKEKEEHEAKMERYRQVYQRVHHEQQKVSRQAPHEAKNLKDKMRSLKSMGRRFEKERDHLAKRPDFEESIVVRFEDEIVIPQGKVVLDLQLATLKVGERVLSRDVHLNIQGPEKVCIVGANGAGKTTLLRRVLEDLTHRGIHFGYMPQDYSEQMNPRESAIEFLTISGTRDENTTIRTYLGSMNFTAEEMYHPIVDLSGGQRAKLYFSKMILEKAEVLVLDEPTRNLSPLSGPEIRAALQAFGGSVIAVSHDRKFLAEVFHRVLLLDEKGLRPLHASEWTNESRSDISQGFADNNGTFQDGRVFLLAQRSLSLELVQNRIHEVLHCFGRGQDVLDYIGSTSGKRLRPLLVLLTFDLCGGTRFQEAIDCAAGVELVHMASLIHDDIIDRSQLRRGQLTAHCRFGTQAAVLAGDHLFAAAFHLFALGTGQRVSRVMTTVIQDMCAGEIHQLLSPVTEEEDYLDYIQKKTACLFGGCCRLGAILSDLDDAEGHIFRSLAKA